MARGPARLAAGRQAPVEATEAHAEAVAAHVRGWPVFPCQPANKRPDARLMAAAGLRDSAGRVGWGPLQDRPTTDAELAAWRSAGAFGLVCGHRSGVVALDVDPGGLESLRGKHLPPTVTARTPRGGYHHLFRHPGRYVSTLASVAPGLDMRGDGGYIVLPGAPGRAWVEGLSPDDIELAPLPDWLAELVVRDPPAKRTPRPKAEPSLLPSAPELLHDLKGPALVQVFRSRDAVLRMAEVLGLDLTPTLACFDILPGMAPDNRRSASLWCNPSGVYVYRSFRRGNGQYTLGEVRAALAYGKVQHFTTERDGALVTQPQAAVWSLLLAAEAGLWAPVPVPHRALPARAPENARRVYTGFLKLLSIKWAHSPALPTAFSWTFAAAWSGMHLRTVQAGMKWLMGGGYVRKVDQYTGRWGKQVNIFLPGEP